MINIFFAIDIKKDNADKFKYYANRHDMYITQGWQRKQKWTNDKLKRHSKQK